MMTKKFFAFVAFLATIIPALFVLDKVGGLEHWRGVLPQGVTDSLYYYARIHEVADGHPFIGNPYVLEYQDTYSPAFFLPDLVSAIPLVFGIPFNFAILLNIFVWSFVFLILAYKLLTLLKIQKNWAIIWSLFMYIGSYSFMLRPTVMQTIFPLFLFFLITFLQFLYEPHIKKRIVSLAFVSALTFYFYNYLAFIVFFTLAIVFLVHLTAKRYKELRSLTMVGLYTTVLLVPFGMYSLMQMSSPLYFETLSRIGLIYTRIPSLESFFYGRWIVVGLASFVVLWRIFPKKDNAYIEKRIFWCATGGALFVGLFMNVLTGAELTLGMHIGRFVVLWLLILLGVFVHEWYFSQSNKSKRITISAHVLIGVLTLILSIGVVRNIPRALAVFKFDERGYKVAELQAYAGPLQWLEEHTEKQSVVWSNMSFAGYVPVMTKHYTLFHLGTTLHAIPKKELEERFLLSQSLEEVTIDTLREDFELYAGSGLSTDLPRVHNTRASFCTAASKVVTMPPCPKKTDALTLQGDVYFENLMRDFIYVKDNRKSLLAKYNVKYLVVDTKNDEYKVPVATSSAVYNDGRFLIFQAVDLP